VIIWIPYDPLKTSASIQRQWLLVLHDSVAVENVEARLEYSSRASM